VDLEKNYIKIYNLFPYAVLAAHMYQIVTIDWIRFICILVSIFRVHSMLIK